MASEIAISVLVSAPVSGATMNLNDGTNYTVVDWSPPSVTYRRSVVTGRYQGGRRSTGEVIDSATMTGVIRVSGATWTNARNSAFKMAAQLAQHSYTIAVKMAGRTETYECEPADMELTAASLNSSKIAGVSGKPRHEYTITIPCYPVPSEES